jgi:catechol-2,3-dioxygenase
MASPTKLAHVVLFTKQVPQMRDWYVTVLDGRVVHQNPAAAFITYDDEHHRIAVTDPAVAAKMAQALFGKSEGLVGAGAAPSVEWTGQQPGDLPPHGLAHIAFTYDTLEDLLGNYERLKAESILPTVTINHGTTTSMYFADPDGNQIELQVDNFATAAEGTEFMESQSFRNNPVGVAFDANELIDKLHSGVPARELMAPSW